MENERTYRTNREKFNIYGSAALIKTGKGTLLFQLKDAGAPSGDANKLTTFGGKRELFEGHLDRGFKSRELTTEAVTREVQEELSIHKDLIADVHPFGYQSFNYEDNPDKGFSVHTVKLKPEVTIEDLDLTEGRAIVEGTLEEILARDDLFPPIREMLERNQERIEKWASENM